ncbi:MAG: hypothetical protein IPK19_28630 [Chloroflexi bacterium]|nr:hypothetical protein [Chloroflexota bacterium]
MADPHTPFSNGTDPLNQREREILACMAEGLSNQEIAARLVLAGNTVRWYNSQIYSKLGVSNRDEAVQQARALGLLDPTPETLAREGKHNLPEPATDFVGRRREMRELQALIADQRLVTILAAGGMGKTRLSMEIARTQVGAFSDGVYFVPLAPLSAPNDIVTTIADTIGFVFHGQTPPTQQLVSFLKDRAMLLMLDNFEHLMEGAGLISDIIKYTSNIKIIVTSRERLNLQGENVYGLRGLVFPTWETPEDAMEYDAVKLFLQSAKHVRSDFELHPDDRGFLARICRLTAGMPLGIELAAGWVDVLSLEQIAGELQRGIDILETEMRDLPERHRSLRATFEQTWTRLTPDEQAAFARLSVFRGGFTLEAAEAVAGATIRHLRKLAQKSLVQSEANERYSIHELLRQFGEDKWAETEELRVIQGKHAAFFADFMAERDRDMRSKRQIEALKLIEPDFENVRSAWQVVVSHQTWDQLPKFLHSLWFYLDMRNSAQAGATFLEPAVKLLRSISPNITTDLSLGQVLARLSWFTRDVGSFESSAVLGDEAIRILRDLDSPEDLLFALFNRALPEWFQNRPDRVLEFSQEGLALAESIGNKSWAGVFLTWVGAAYVYHDIDLALRFTEEGVVILEEHNDHQGLLHGAVVLSLIKELQHDYEQASFWAERLRLGAQALGNVFLYALPFVVQGRILLAQKDDAGARANLGKGLQLYWDAGYRWFIAFPLTYVVQWLAERKELEKAVEVRAAIDGQLVRFQQADRVARALYDQLKAQMDPDRFAAAWSRGKSRDLGQWVLALLAEL